MAATSGNARRAWGGLRSILQRLAGLRRPGRDVWSVVNVVPEGDDAPLYYSRDRELARRMARSATFRAAGRMAVIPVRLSGHVTDVDALLEQLNLEAESNLDALLRSNLGPRRAWEPKWRRNRDR